MTTKTRQITEEHWYYDRNRFWDQKVNPWARLGYVKRNITNTVDHGPNLENWRRRIALGLSACTYLRGSQTSVSGSFDGFYYSSYKDKFLSGGEFEKQGCFSAFVDVPGNPDSLSLSAAKNEALVIFNAKAAKALTAMQSLVAAGELGETARMLKSHGRSIKRGVVGYVQDLDTKVFRGGFNPRAALRDVSGRYLEFVFGIKPLVADIEDALSGLDRLQYRSPRLRVTGVGMSDRNVSTSSMSIACNHGATIRFKKIRKQSVRYKLTGMVSINPTIPPVMREFGITWGEFIPTLWELLPWSFLVDYFANLGDIIGALRVQRSNVNWVMYGWEKKERIYAEPDIFTPGTNPDPNRFNFTCQYRPASEEYSVESRVVERDNFHESLVPALAFEIPGLGAKWLNMAALAAQFGSLQSRVRRSL
jgi:hypothetical protein